MAVKFHPKTTAGALAGALTVVLIAEAGRRGVTIDGTEGASITMIFAFIAGYFMPSDDSDGTPAAPPPPAPPAS
jgi:hypothetical protein